MNVGLQEVCERQMFEYQSLPDAARYLRMNTIHPAETNNATIECTLSTQPILNLPEYHAVSYTWVNPNRLATIKVNGSLLEVRQSCEYVLRQARHLARSKYIWIDAICIN